MMPAPTLTIDSPLLTQHAFRAVLDAMARPGTVQQLPAFPTPPAPLAAGTAAIAKTLCDQDTPIWLDGVLQTSRTVAEWLRFHCGAKIVDQPDIAAFAFVAAPAELPPLSHFNLGTLDYPERSTTIVLQVDSFSLGANLILAGPGIRNRNRFRVAPVPSDFAQRLADNRALAPRGVDLILVTENQVAALPRAVRLANGAP